MRDVAVTQRHIDDSKSGTDPEGTTHNPIARATCEVLGVPVGSVHISPTGRIEYIDVKTVPPPSGVPDSMLWWLMYRVMNPFRFAVDL